MFVETLRHESYSLALSTAPQLAMTQEQLCGVWLHAQHGRLSAWEQAKALALREASRELHGRTQLVWIAARVEKAGGGHQSLGALHKLFKVVDADDGAAHTRWAKRTEP